MEFDYRLLLAIRAYEKMIKETHCLSFNGEVPVRHKAVIKRIAKWSNKIVQSGEKSV